MHDPANACHSREAEIWWTGLEQSPHPLGYHIRDWAPSEGQLQHSPAAKWWEETAGDRSFLHVSILWTTTCRTFQQLGGGMPPPRLGFHGFGSVLGTADVAGSVLPSLTEAAAGAEVSPRRCLALEFRQRLSADEAVRPWLAEGGVLSLLCKGVAKVETQRGIAWPWGPWT
jgi:hypothetical protein